MQTRSSGRNILSTSITLGFVAILGLNALLIRLVEAIQDVWRYKDGCAWTWLQLSGEMIFLFVNEIHKREKKNGSRYSNQRPLERDGQTDGHWLIVWTWQTTLKSGMKLVIIGSATYHIHHSCNVPFCAVRDHSCDITLPVVGKGTVHGSSSVSSVHLK